MRAKRFLFCIVGVGAGNTTRNLAILEELQRQGRCEILIAAQGRALELLRERYKTIGLQTIKYSDSGNLTPWDLVRSNLSFPTRFLENRARLTEVMKDFRPDLVVADSDFYCLQPARKLGLRLASINNAAVVVEMIRREGGLPANCRFSYHAIEKTDYLLQRRYPHRVLCPTVKRLPGLGRKFVQIPPMVRPEIQPLAERGEEIVVLTGGSGMDTANIDLRSLEGMAVRTVGTHLEKVPSGTRQIGFSLDVMEHLRHAKVLVVQGGFSSISEAVALRVPTVVLPVANQAEQWSNGKAIESLGMGVSVAAPQAGEAVQYVLRQLDQYWRVAQGLRVPTDGHRHAARALWRWAQ